MSFILSDISFRHSSGHLQFISAICKLTYLCETNIKEQNEITNLLIIIINNFYDYIKYEELEYMKIINKPDITFRYNKLVSEKLTRIIRYLVDDKYNNYMDTLYEMKRLNDYIIDFQKNILSIDVNYNMFNGLYIMLYMQG